MSGFMCWWYQGADGTPVFQHYRVNDPDLPRGKRYGYRSPAKIVDNRVVEWVRPWTKHPLADSLIYRLPLVLANPDARLVLTEGERDAVAAIGRRILATSHHGGAGKFTQAQAESLAGHRGPIVLVADNDPAGAYDVCRRYDLLLGVGIPASRLRVREVSPPHQGADLRDHLEAGYRFGDLKRADLDRLREVAATVTGDWSEGSWGVTSDEIEQIKNWRPTVVRRAECPDVQRGRVGRAAPRPPHQT